MTEFPVLNGRRVLLRLPEERDIPAITGYFKVNEVHFAPTNPVLPPNFLSEEYWQGAVPRSRDEFVKDASIRLFIFDPADDRTVFGTANFTQCARGPFQACYLGYGIGKSHEGRGLMTEALDLAIRYAFGPRNFHRIMANYLPENHRSASLLKRLGFSVEGRASQYLFINGAWRDHVLNALTNPNWIPK